MPDDALPRIGVFCTSRVDDQLDFALRSIALNTEYPNFEMLVGADPGLDGTDPTPILDGYKKRYPWFDYVFYADRPADRLGLGSPNDLLEDLYQRLKTRGCTRFFQINDDIAVTRYWLHYAESAMRRLDGVGVVIPHDGVLSVDESRRTCGFYYFSEEYIQAYHPHGKAFRTDPIQCYWVDTEFCLRAAKLGRLAREPRCCLLHLHVGCMPKTTGLREPRRTVRADPAGDARLFIKYMRDECIDPFRYIPDLERFTPKEVWEEMASLRGCEDELVGHEGVSPCELLPMTEPVPFARAARREELPYFVSFPRTGSHWMRMFLELYFDQPLLVRSFFRHPSEDYLLIHTHDRDQVHDRRDVLYQYRSVVNTIFSEVSYHHGEDAPNMSWAVVEETALAYIENLSKWLLRDDVAHRKCVVTYESLLDEPYETLANVIEFFGGDVDQARMERFWPIVTHDLVARRTRHDPNIAGRTAQRQVERDLFRYRFGGRILDRFHEETDLIRVIDPRLLT
ncbi:MAG: hypothetical protein KAS72_09985 [Phycisphaerales bacterium]|nr:hypothetical protein [Phycisphaerales bacterium]